MIPEQYDYNSYRKMNSSLQEVLTKDISWYNKSMNQFIKNYIKNNTNYSDSDIGLIYHGLQIVLQDGSEILSALITGFCFHRFLPVLLYVLIYGLLRTRCGGHHSKTRPGCYVTYMMLFFIFLFFLSFPFPEYFVIPVFLSVLYIVKNAPVQHLYNPLSYNEMMKNQTESRLLSLISFILFLLCLRHNYGLSYSFSFPLIYTAVFMAVLKNSPMFRKDSL